jgi:hypothetical protein
MTKIGRKRGLQLRTDVKHQPGKAKGKSSAMSKSKV